MKKKISFSKGSAAFLKLAFGKVRPTFWKKIALEKVGPRFYDPFSKGLAAFLEIRVVSIFGN